MVGKKISEENRLKILNLNISYYLNIKEGIDKTVVFIHGFSSNHQYFLNLYGRIFDNLDYNFLAFSLPGHGKSDLPKTDFGFLDHVKISHLIIKKLLKKKQLYLHGHSMGGGIALALNTFSDLNIKDTVVISPMNRTSLSKRIILNKYYLPLTLKDAKKLLALIYHQGGTYIRGYKSLQRFREDLRELWSNPQRTSYLSKLLGTLHKEENMSLIDNGIKKTTPLTLFFGTSDGIIDLFEIVDYFLDLNPDTKIYPRHQIGHTPWNEDPSTYKKWIEKHYSKL